MTPVLLQEIIYEVSGRQSNKLHSKWRAAASLFASWDINSEANHLKNGLYGAIKIDWAGKYYYKQKVLEYLLLKICC